MARTFRRVNNKAAHYKKRVMNLDLQIFIPIRVTRIQPLKKQLPVLEAKFHSDNFPNIGKKPQNERRLSRSMRRINRSLVHRCVRDIDFGESQCYPKRVDSMLAHH